jgi:RNA polymerase sigma-70 factor (ECF subfamily)
MTTRDPEEERLEPEPKGPEGADTGDSPKIPGAEVNEPEPTGYSDTDMQTEATQLMTAVQAGDPDAFNTLVVRLRGRSYQVARALVGSRDDAMDLSQEAFLKVFRARETYNPSQPFLPWFHRILRNTCFSFLRKNKRLKKHSLTTVGGDGEETDWEIVDEGPGPSEGLLQDERARIFHEALRSLSSRDREILALRHFKDLAYKEIATTLGIPEGTVMSRLFHARRRLRDALGPLLDEISPDVQTTRDSGKGGR